MKVQFLFLVHVAILGSGCSLLLDFEPNGRPCTPEGECLPGYACILDRCIPSHSVLKGGSCFQNANCDEELVCSNFVCAPQCSSLLSTQECQPGSICNVGNNAYQNHVLGCTPAPDCSNSPEIPCSADNEICYVPESDPGFCLPGCTPACTLGQICENPCENEGTCQFIKGFFLCLPAGSAQLGEPCSVGSNPCALGSVCISDQPNSPEGACFAYCDTESPTCPTVPGQQAPICEAVAPSLGLCMSAK